MERGSIFNVLDAQNRTINAALFTANKAGSIVYHKNNDGSNFTQLS